MVRRGPITFVLPLALVILGALTVAACGSAGGATAATRTTPSGHQATVTIAARSLGRTLVDAQGPTLYLFEADSGSQRACSGACAVAWPRLLTRGTPGVGKGVRASLITTIRRPNGAQQVSYNGHALYLFADDHKPGEVNGQGVIAFGAPQYVVSKAGVKPEAAGEPWRGNELGRQHELSAQPTRDYPDIGSQDRRKSNDHS